MSERKRRLDTSTRITTDPERRKRRNLSDYPLGNVGAAGPLTDVVDPPEISCPNIGPIDSGPEQCSIQTVSIVLGYEYRHMVLGTVGAVAGQDTISYCYDARVGPGTGAIECYCEEGDGTPSIGLLVNGKLYDTGEGFPDDSWETSMATLGAAYYRVKDETNDFWWLQTDGNPLPGTDEYFYIRPLFMKEVEEVWTCAYITWKGSGGCWYCLWWNEPVEGCDGHRGHQGVMACRTAGFFDGVGAEDAHAHGWGGCFDALGVYAYPARTIIPMGQSQVTGSPSFWKQNSSSDVNTLRLFDAAGSGTEHTSTNTAFDGQAGIVLSYQFTHGDEGGGYRLGWLTACTSREVKVQGMPTGWYARMTDHQRWYAVATPTVWLTSGVAVAGVCTVDFLGNHPPFGTWEIYDDNPNTTGVLQFTCDIPRGIWGGDLYEYYPSGGCEETEVLVDVESKIIMYAYDSQDNIIGSVVPDGYSGSAWGRVDGAIGYAIPANTYELRFELWKTGSGNGFACSRNLQVNLGDEYCCAYTDPGTGTVVSSQSIASPSTLIVAEGGEVAGTDQDGKLFVGELWDSDRKQIVTGSDVGAAVDEHRQGQQNVAGFDSHAEQDGPGNGTVGNPSTGSGYFYDRIDMVEWGIEEGDPLSVRFKGKVV